MSGTDPADIVREALQAVIYTTPGWSGPDPWFKPKVEAALVALAELEKAEALLRLADELADAYGRYWAKDAKYYAYQDARAGRSREENADD